MFSFLTFLFCYYCDSHSSLEWIFDRFNCLKQIQKWLLISLQSFSWFSCRSPPGIFFFFYSGVAYSPPNVLSSKCTLHIPEASPTIILKENHWWIEWQSVASLLMFCIAVLKNAAVLCRGIYLINSLNPCKESLLWPSPCSIWSPCKHSALWSGRTNLRWIAALLHGFTDTLSEAQTLQIAVYVLSRCVISLIFSLYVVCGSLKGYFWC